MVSDRGTVMEPLESQTHSFIIKIWRERVRVGSGMATWRGHITHVPGGERRYLKGFNDIADFIIPYVEAIGVKPGRYWRVRRWLRQCKQRLMSRT
jgi:hypothetical protein